MRFEMEAGGRVHLVEARPGPRDWHVTVNGRALHASVTRVGDRWSLLVGPPGAGHYESYDIAIETRGSSDRLVHIDGRVVPVSVVGARAAIRRRDAHTGDADGPLSIGSPIAGRVVKVLVTKGEAVTARQGLLIVEAMKMENELRAPRAGTVADVRVVEGASIDAGTVLVVIE